MVIYLSRIETLVLIPASPQTILNWWSTGCSDYESHSVYSACVPANPNRSDAPSIKFSNKLKRGCSRVVRCSEGKRTTASINRCQFLQMAWVLTVHVTCTEVELSTTGLCMLTTTSPNSFCTRRWSTPWAVGLMSAARKQMQACRVERWRYSLRSHYNQFSYLCTLGPDRLRHGAGVAEPLSIDCPDDK